MLCSEAKKYDNWCKEFPTVEYKDEEGNEYCVFHAPQGKKGVTVEKFNEMVFEKIIKTKNNEYCDLSGTIFEGDIWFSRFNRDNPLPKMIFSGATFSGSAYFFMVTFSGKADFFAVKFRREAYFSEATFCGHASFVGAKFNEIIDFMGAIFNEEANFFTAKFNGEVMFDNVTFKKEVFLVKVNIKNTIKFENVNLKEVSFMDTDMRKIDSINCIWPTKYNRKVLYDEITLFRERKYKNFKDNIKKLEILYRQLKQKNKEEHNEPEVSNWHYGEKEMFRKGSLFRRYFPISLSNLYWLSSGYGERPLRAGIVLLLLILTIAVLLGITGLIPSNQSLSYEVAGIKGWADIMDFRNLWSLILNTLQYATFEKEPDFVPKTIYGSYLKLAARILIPLQAALFALAVRNRFRR